jgi:hypothetical protein
VIAPVEGGAVPSRNTHPRAGSAATARKGRPTGAAPADTASRPPADGLVIGFVPSVARLAGLLLALAGALGVAAAFPVYLVVGGRHLHQVGGVGTLVVALLVPVLHLAVGIPLARAAVPKFGLAYAAVAAALAVGQLLIEVYRAVPSTSRPPVEVMAGQRVLTSTISIGAGWILGVLALCAVLGAGLCALLAWERTVMEDGGPLDPARSALAGGALMLGVVTVLSLALPAADVPDSIVTDPTTGMQSVVTGEGPQALLERPGLALLGGLLLAGAIVLCSVVAPSLRPRLAAVGALLAISGAVLSAGLTGLRDALVSPALEWTVPGVALLLCGLAYVGLTALAWRWRRSFPEPPSRARSLRRAADS